MRHAVAVMALAALACGGAHAQYGGLTRPISLSIRAGAYRPSSRPAGVSKSWFAAGADLRVNVAAVPIVGGQTVSADYLTRGSSNIAGITLVQRYTSPISAPVQGGMRPYVGLGFGVYRVHVKSDTDEQTKTGPGMKAVAGLELGQGLYVQGDYHMPAMGRVAGMRPKGFAITAGLRF